MQRGIGAAVSCAPRFINKVLKAVAGQAYALHDSIIILNAASNPALGREPGKDVTDMVNLQIAVLTDALEHLAEFEKVCRVKVYEKEDGRWSAVRQVALSLYPLDTPAAVRQKAKELAEAAEGCKVLAGSSMIGLAYGIFDRMGFAIFELSELSDAELNGVAEDLAEDERRKTETEQVMPYPVETGTPGVYRLDLIALQKENPEISSKKAMRPFFESTPFLTLELICHHLPPWLENEGGITIETTQSDGHLRALIAKKCSV